MALAIWANAYPVTTHVRSAAGTKDGTVLLWDWDTRGVASALAAHTCVLHLRKPACCMIPQPPATELSSRSSPLNPQGAGGEPELVQERAAAGVRVLPGPAGGVGCDGWHNGEPHCAPQYLC